MNTSIITTPLLEHPKDVAAYEAMVASTNPVSVIGALSAPDSPTLKTLVVRRRDDLPKVAALLSPRAADARSAVATEARGRRLKTMFREKLLGFGETVTQSIVNPSSEFCVSIAALHPTTPMQVIRLAPFCLLYSPTIEWALNLREKLVSRQQLPSAAFPRQLELELNGQASFPGM